MTSIARISTATSNAQLPLVQFETHEVGRDIYVARRVSGSIKHGFVEPNVVFVIGREAVLVVDAGFLPSSARALIGQLRQLTQKPVRYLINTHWHGDHTHGNSTWLEAYPQMAIVAHAEGRREIIERGIPDLSGFRETYTKRVNELRTLVAASAAADATSQTTGAIQDQRERLTSAEQTLTELSTLKIEIPQSTYTDSLDLDLGDRAVRLLYLGRANTYGDAVVWVPDEKMVITGDLVVHPRPFLTSDHFAAWNLALERVSRLEFTTLIPGHGSVQNDSVYLGQLRALMSTMLLLVDEAAAHGLSDVQAREHITLAVLQRRLLSDWSIPLETFPMAAPNLADFVERVYKERTNSKP